MYKSLKIFTLYLLKYSGIFNLCKFYFRYCPRIICYHGFNVLDESLFIPGTFIKSKTFEKRLILLEKLGSEFIKLDSLVKSFNLPKLPVVLTFDDGFVSTITEGLPILEEKNIPATLYVTTYYQQKQNPIFRLHFNYLVWKSKTALVDSASFSQKLHKEGKIDLKIDADKWSLIQFFEKNYSEEHRSQFLKELEVALGVSLTREQREKSFTLASTKLLEDAQMRGLDLQLHTHRHELPLNRDSCIREVEENRTILKNMTNGDLVHFCYPSGIYDKIQFPWLEEAEVLTATTLVPGIVKKDAHPLELPRILDNENLSLIQFEAEICGVGELLRSLKAPFTKKELIASAT